MNLYIGISIYGLLSSVLFMLRYLMCMKVCRLVYILDSNFKDVQIIVYGTDISILGCNK